MGSWTGRMTDSEGEQVVTCQVTEEWMRLRQEFVDSWTHRTSGSDGVKEEKAARSGDGNFLLLWS